MTTDDPFAETAASHAARAAARTERRRLAEVDAIRDRAEAVHRLDAGPAAELELADTQEAPVAFRVLEDNWEELDGRWVRVIHRIELISLSLDAYPGPTGGTVQVVEPGSCAWRTCTATALPGPHQGIPLWCAEHQPEQRPI